VLLDDLQQHTTHVRLAENDRSGNWRPGPTADIFMLGSEDQIDSVENVDAQLRLLVRTVALRERRNG
jgi:hypothetical protein